MLDSEPQTLHVFDHIWVLKNAKLKVEYWLKEVFKADGELREKKSDWYCCTLFAHMKIPH